MTLFVSQPDYIDLIARFFPTYNVSATGPNYTDINWNGGDVIAQDELDALLLPGYQAALRDAVPLFTGALLAGGYTYQGTVYSFASPTSEIVQGLMLVITSRTDLLPDFAWIDAAGSLHPMSKAQYNIFYNSYMLWTGAIFTMTGQMMGAIAALNSPEACAAFDVAAGWPLTDTDLVTWLAANGYPTMNPRRIISALAFRQRFTATERATITIAAIQSAYGGDATLQLYLDDLSSSTVANLDDPETTAGLSALANAGLLDPTRISTLVADGADAELVQT